VIKLLKFKGDESKYFFVSDLHYRHTKDFLWSKRKDAKGNFYQNSEDHDSGIKALWNSVCNSESIVYNMGDIVFNDSKGDHFWSLLRQLNFREMYLLLGNHTSGQRQAYIAGMKFQHPNAFDIVDGVEQLTYEVYPLRVAVDGNPNKVVIFLPQYAEIQINSTQLILCHYPILSHNGMSHSSLHICGHSHSGCELTNKDTGKGLRLDVGVESFGRPVNLLEVKRHLQGRDIDSRDHH